MLALLLEEGDRFFGVLRDGEIRDVRPFPTDTIGSIDPFMRIATLGSAGPYWAAAYVFGSRFYVYRAAELVCAGSLRGANPFVENQRVTGNEREAAAGTVVGDTSVWMLAIDMDDRERRLLDEYSLATCQFLRSLPLPVRARTLAFHDGVFFVEHARVAPEILALRPTN